MPNMLLMEKVKAKLGEGANLSEFAITEDNMKKLLNEKTGQHRKEMASKTFGGRNLNRPREH